MATAAERFLTRPVIAQPSRILESLRSLSERPGVLFGVLWALSALCAPYANFLHDAKLYGLLVLNRASDEAFAGDLFLQFGSQERYSPFSRVAAPLVRLLGVEWTFFLLFLISNALLVYAIQRVVTALLDDRPLSMLASMFMVAAPLPYGGLRVFQVHEAFFTPRIAGSALALLGLEQTLRRNHGRALGYSSLATLVHPLMGFGGLAISTGCAAVERLPRRWLWRGLGALSAAGVLVLAVPPVGRRVFGSMDPEWLGTVRRASAWNVPGEWMMSDWFRTLLALGILIAVAASRRRLSPERARLVLATSVLGVVGLVATVVATTVPYRLLLQSQPYRVLWIVVALHVPLAVWLAARLWREGVTGQVLAVALVGVVGIPDFSPLEPVVFVIALPLFALVQRGARATARRSDWLVRSVAGAFVVAVLVSATIKIGGAATIARDVLELVDLFDYGRILSGAPGPLVWLCIVLVVVGAALGRVGSQRTVLWVGIGLALAVHATAFLVPRTSAYRQSEQPDGRDIAFVRAYLARRASVEPPPPTVYAGAWGNVAYLWFDLGVNSYFDLSQVAGVIFSRHTALEVVRRGDLVRPFEVDRYRRLQRFAAPALRVTMNHLFHPEPDTPAPTRADLVRLCRDEERLAMAILRQRFVDLSSTSNGRISIYECAHVRAVASLAGHRNG